MLVVDHINLLGGNPLVGPNPEELGARFPDMSEVYDSRLLHLAEESALSRGIHFVRGVYIARAAETSKESEANLLRRLGGDAVGEGIVPEAIVAVHGGMKVLGMIRLEASPGDRESSSTPTTLGIAEIVAGVVSRI